MFRPDHWYRRATTYSQAGYSEIRRQAATPVSWTLTDQAEPTNISRDNNPTNTNIQQELKDNIIHKLFVFSVCIPTVS